jgi:hypothetical protein
MLSVKLKLKSKGKFESEVAVHTYVEQPIEAKSAPVPEPAAAPEIIPS